MPYDYKLMIYLGFSELVSSFIKYLLKTYTYTEVYLKVIVISHRSPIGR